MFKNTYQNGLLSIFYSCGSNPLAIWDMEVKNGHIKRLTDSEVNSIVLEIVSTNVATTYITCPKNNQVLGIKLPFLVMIVKNLKRYFSFEITILDDRNMRRRFRISNFQSSTKIKPFCTSMPIGLSGGWNQIQFNLADFTRRAYGSQFVEALRVQVHANARLRRIYFSERLYTEDELPQEYKLYLPLEHKKKGKGDKNTRPSEAAAPITETSQVSEKQPSQLSVKQSSPASEKRSSHVSVKQSSQAVIKHPSRQVSMLVPEETDERLEVAEETPLDVTDEQGIEGEQAEIDEIPAGLEEEQPTDEGEPAEKLTDKPEEAEELPADQEPQISDEPQPEDEPQTGEEPVDE